MLERFLGGDNQLATGWNEMGSGAPTLIALAQICSQAMSASPTVTPSLSPEAKAILYMARDRGILEVKGSNAAYESSSRLLTVFVEVDDQSQLRFRHPRDARQNVRFLEGFRELCANGLVMHHLYHEFSLTSSGFELAESLSPEEFENLLDLCQPSRGQ
jgi:hypothetical protein